MKKDRHSIILQLIEKYTIGTQEELLQKLIDCGVNVTQATVSRDIKSLQLVKKPVAGGLYKYSAPAVTDERYIKYHSIFAESVFSVDYAVNLCVVKCHTGMANAACAAIDTMNLNGILGTVAGDDTILIICKTEENAVATVSTLNELLKVYTMP